MPGVHSTHQAREYARQVVQSFLAREWIDLYVSADVMTNDTIEIVPSNDRSKFVESDLSWLPPDGQEILVWFRTTEKWYMAYEHGIV
jgi:hypothetical protein